MRHWQWTQKCQLCLKHRILLNSYDKKPLATFKRVFFFQIQEGQHHHHVVQDVPAKGEGTGCFHKSTAEICGNQNLRKQVSVILETLQWQLLQTIFFNGQQHIVNLQTSLFHDIGNFDQHYQPVGQRMQGTDVQKLASCQSDQLGCEYQPWWKKQAMLQKQKTSQCINLIVLSTTLIDLLIY